MADQGKNLDELIEEAEALLEQEKQEKPRKRKKGESKRVEQSRRSDFEI